MVLVPAGTADAAFQDLQHELRMLKACVLYGHTVTLATQSLEAIKQFAAVQKLSPERQTRVYEIGMTRQPGWTRAISMSGPRSWVHLL